MCVQATSGMDRSQAGQAGWDNGSLFLSWVYKCVVKAGCGGWWSKGGVVFGEGQAAGREDHRGQGWAASDIMSWGKGRGDRGALNGERARVPAAQMHPSFLVLVLPVPRLCPLGGWLWSLQ